VLQLHYSEQQSSGHFVALQRVRNKVRVCLLRGSHHLESMVMRWRLAGQPTAYECQIIADLETEGVHVTTMERLLPEAAPAIREALGRASLLLANQPASEHAAIWARRLPSTDLLAEVLLSRAPEIYLLGVHRRMLELAQRYLRLPVAYHGAVLRHSLVDGEHVGPRLWHQDNEDFRVLRMLVYVTDVGPGNGPFEYVPRNLGISYRDFHGVENDLTSDRMERVVPRERWKRCIGAPGTVVLCDTANVFHHESLQTQRDRAVVMFGYSSRRPKNLRCAMAHFPVERVRPALQQIVPAENHGHVFGWRRELPGLTAHGAQHA
jgi:hypothetical protein